MTLISGRWPRGENPDTWTAGHEVSSVNRAAALAVTWPAFRRIRNCLRRAGEAFIKGCCPTEHQPQHYPHADLDLDLDLGLTRVKTACDQGVPF